MSRQYDDDDYEIIDGQKVLKDGRTLRVRMTDSQRVRITDGRGDSRLATLSRPGFRVADGGTEKQYWARDAQVVARQAAYDAYVQDLCNAYRTISDADEEWGEEGAECTVREGGSDEGSPGHLKLIRGRLTCVPDEPVQDAARDRAATLRDAAYRDYCNWLQGQWKS